MLDHTLLSIPAPRFAEVVSWYTAALAPIGYTIQKEFADTAVGFGPDRTSIVFWLAAKKVPAQKDAAAGTEAGAASDAGAKVTVWGAHVAFRAKDRTAVDAFHEEAVKAGGTCNGKPGWRHMYHPKYYAGFVFDPVG